MQTVEHPRRPARLEAQKLTVLPEAQKTDCVVWFPIPDAVQDGPEAEGVPAVRVDKQHARLTGIPFFPYHTATGDLVQVREHNGALYAVEVVEAAPVLVARIFQENNEIPVEQAMNDPSSDEAFWSIMRALAPHGCWFERYSTSYAALLVDQHEWEFVRAFLDLRARVGSLQWELATPLRAPNESAQANSS